MTSSSYTGLQDETSAQKHPASRSHLHKVADQGSESDPLLDADATGLLRPESRQQAKIARYQFAAICWCLYLAGWNDGSIGPLLPRIKAEYEVSFTVVSFIFVSGCSGLVLGAMSNVYFADKINFGKIIFVGSLCQLASFFIQSLAPPFPVLVFAFFINGIGSAVQDSQANGFVAVLENSPETKMGLIHAAYGLGAFSSPLIATQFAQMPNWSHHFLVSAILAILNSIVIAIIFRGRTQDDCLSQIGQRPGERNTSEQSQSRQILSNPAVHLLAFFILMYVGVEITIGGWIVTYIIEVRGGGPSAGYVSSGFFGGLTLGRVLLLWVNAKIGERRALFIYAVLALGFELVVWVIPSLIWNAIAISIVGMLLGPMFPMAMNHSRRILPRWILTGSIGWITGFGQAGSAVLPFITGSVVENFGMESLQPLLVTMMVMMMILWGVLPNKVATRNTLV